MLKIDSVQIMIVGGCVMVGEGGGVRHEVWKKYEIGVIVNKC